MAVRVIPRKTKVKMEFLKNITLSDLIYLIICVSVALALLIGANFNYHIYVGVAWVAFATAFFVQIEEGIRIYTFLGLVFRFFAFRKKYSKDKQRGYANIKSLIPYAGLYYDNFIDFEEYKAGVIEISPITLGLFNEFKQDMVINTFANAIRRLTAEQSATIIKLSRPLVLDNYINLEEEKLDVLYDMVNRGEISAKEFESRSGVFENRVLEMDRINNEEKTYKDYFYLVVYDNDIEILSNTIEGIINTLGYGVTPIAARQIVGKELYIFLKSQYGKDFNERDLKTMLDDDMLNWILPKKVEFRMGSTLIDGQAYKHFSITDYPLYVSNAWGYSLANLPNSKVIINFKMVPRIESERQIDRAIMETETKLQRTGRAGAQIELQTHLETLRELLQNLKNNNEALYDVNIHVVCEEAQKKEVKALLRQNGFKYSEMFGRQVDSFISSAVSRIDTIKENRRGIPTTTFASIFPFVSSELQDPKGFYIGYNEYPVFVDFFKRDNERVNSNMMIIGKSGSGKSFATKTLLTNLAADNSKVFILDPEDEYSKLSKNLCGKNMDVGSSVNGIFNPFHIMTSLKDDTDEDDREKERKKFEKKLYDEGYSEEEIEVKLKEYDEKISLESEKTDDSFSLHLQFLEEFFKIIMEGLNSDAFELLNSLVMQMYKSKGINEKTRIRSLKPEDFPIFDDLMVTLKNKIKTEKDAYRKQNYQIIETYVEKFATGGRNSNLWNGPTSIQTKENFITFNFRSLLANRNKTIASAQMLLVFKYLDNEIIKNREFNLKYLTNRKIIVVVDEAHVFINPNYPIALDFMAQMAKRIRKYSGMQIIITQNIKDFVGNEQIERQSTAIINASQYSFIFSLAPNDITDLVALYRNAGEINEEEQNTIVTAGRGQCFLITGPLSRRMVQIHALPFVRELFGD